jgi:hypothetical protein
MKTEKIILILGLALVFAASMVVLVHACDVDEDCSDWTPQGCLGDHLYDVKYFCDDGSCMVKSTTDKGKSATCDDCKTCNLGSAWYLPSDSEIDYTPNFYNAYDDYVIDGNGVYVLAPGTTMEITDISDVLWMCGNGVLSGDKTLNLNVWVYNNSDNRMLSTAHNNLDIGSVEREDVIGSDSKLCGTPVLNPWVMFYQWGYMSNTEINNIYTFNKPSKYTAFIDMINGYCAPENEDDAIIAQNYVCPWLGGTERSKICPGLYGNGYKEGWMPQESLSILVPNPDITIAPPSDEPDHVNASYLKSWNINNTGLGDVSFTITSDCGGVGWSCSFVGYTQGSEILLDMGELYTVTMDITPNQADTNPHQVGIKVTYDDGYDFSTIPSQIKTSYITFGSSGTTTTIPSVTSTIPDNYIT